MLLTRLLRTRSAGLFDALLKVVDLAIPFNRTFTYQALLQIRWQTVDRHIHRAVTKLSVFYILKWCAWNNVVRPTTSSVATQMAGIALGGQTPSFASSQVS